MVCCNATRMCPKTKRTVSILALNVSIKYTTKYQQLLVSMVWKLLVNFIPLKKGGIVLY